jgi:hypothetical protein
MPNSLLVSVGADLDHPGKFYWNIVKNDENREQLHLQRGFESVESATADLERFRRDLANSIVLANL